MRQIKFRGKRKDNGLWVYGYYFEAPLTHETGECDSYLCGDRRFLISQNCVTFDVLPETVCQSTGLLDKDGTEIYEGDIVESPNYPNNQIVANKDGVHEIIVVWVNPKGHVLSVIVHELFHAVVWAMRNRLIYLDNESCEETYAYLLESLTRKVFDKIRIRKG